MAASPWSLFFVLGLAACVRAYYLCVSLHFAGGERHDLRPLLLVPLLGAVAVLLLEAGLTSHSRLLQKLGLAVGPLLVLLAGMGENRIASILGSLLCLSRNSVARRCTLRWRWPASTHSRFAKSPHGTGVAFSEFVGALVLSTDEYLPRRRRFAGLARRSPGRAIATRLWDSAATIDPCVGCSCLDSGRDRICGPRHLVHDLRRDDTTQSVIAGGVIDWCCGLGRLCPLAASRGSGGDFAMVAIFVLESDLLGEYLPNLVCSAIRSHLPPLPSPSRYWFASGFIFTPPAHWRAHGL